MALSHVYHTKHTAQISISKINALKTITAAKSHNQRDNGVNHGGHIDQRREKLNQSIKGNEQVYVDIINRITGKDYTDETIKFVSKDDLRYGDGKKVRSTAVLAFETEMRYPGDMVWSTFNKNGDVIPVDANISIDATTTNAIEKGGKGYFLYPADMKEFEEWQAASIEFMNDRFGEDNIFSIQLHMDELTPHLHFIGTPIYQDKNGVNKLSFKHYIDGPADTAKLHTDYAKSVEHLGYVRGEKFSPLNYSDMAQARAYLSEAIQETLPEDPKEAQKAYSTVKAKLAKANIELENRRGTSETVQRLRIKLDEARKKNREKEEKIHELQRENQRLRDENQRRLCELKGMELHEDQGLMKNVYSVLQDQLVESGEKWYEDHGFDIRKHAVIDRNHDGIDDRTQSYVDSDGNGIDDREE